MKNLNIYLQESLLDDWDDLEKAADKSIEDSSYIGGQYNVKYVKVEGSFLSNFNPRLLSKLNLKYKSTTPYSLWYDHTKRKPSKYCQSIVNLVLNTNIRLLTKDPKTSDDIKVKDELIEKLYSCSYLADDKNFLSIDAYHGIGVDYVNWYIEIYNDQDQSLLKISLVQKN